VTFQASGATIRGDGITPAIVKFKTQRRDFLKVAPHDGHIF
jgi:hypothetical protein